MRAYVRVCVRVCVHSTPPPPPPPPPPPHKHSTALRGHTFADVRRRCFSGMHACGDKHHRQARAASQPGKSSQRADGAWGVCRIHVCVCVCVCAQGVCVRSHGLECSWRSVYLSVSIPASVLAWKMEMASQKTNATHLTKFLGDVIVSMCSLRPCDCVRQWAKSVKGLVKGWVNG